MTDRAARILVRTLYALALAALVAVVWLAVLNGTAREDVELVILGILVVVANGTLGALLAIRQRHNPIGWLFLAFALSLIVSILGEEYATFALMTSPGSSPGATFALWATQTPPTLAAAAMVLVFLLFPTGHVHTRRWRPLVWLIGAASAVAFVALTVGPETISIGRGARGPNPFAIEGLEPAAGVAAMMAGFAMFGSGLASIASVFFRYRRAGPEERQQIRWLAYVAVAALTMVAGLLISDSLGTSPVEDFFWLGTWFVIALGVPAASAIAVLKYRLYELDLVVKKTVVFGVLAAFITLLYFVFAIGIPTLLFGAGGGLETLVPFVATALLAIAFQPIRRAANRFADRLVYGRRKSPYEVLAEFSDRMSRSSTPDDVVPAIADIARTGTGADRAEVWVRVGRELRRSAASPPIDGGVGAVEIAGESVPLLPDADVTAPVVDRGELVGAISAVAPRNAPFSESQERLLRDLASHAALALRNVRLIEELRASRERLVAAQDEERRRIERNIHDGAQQQLVALSVNLKLARTLASKDPERAGQMLERLQADTQTALEDLRDLARGIYPPLLADKGLAAALEAQARKSATPVAVESNGIGRFSREAEAAVYFCVLEALQNAGKYARASRMSVHLRRSDGHVVFEVEDDGRGFDPERTARGSGLQNMADRLEALGGRLEIRSAPGRGTRVIGRVPVREREDVR